jgi:CheY-like chemotaxis protein
MASGHRNPGDHRRLAHVPRAPGHRPGTSHLYRGMGAHDRWNRDCVRNQDAPGNQRRMVSDPYGSGINHLRGTASVEPCRWCRRRDLAHRMVRGHTGRSRDLFWFPAAQPACAAGILSRIGGRKRPICRRSHPAIGAFAFLVSDCQELAQLPRFSRLDSVQCFANGICGLKTFTLAIFRTLIPFCRMRFEICQPEIDRKRLVRSVNLGARKVHLRADPARLQQIFWNLINNAVKFTPTEGQIFISTSNDSQGQLDVKIADSGLGIEPESLPKIFDAFEQGGRTQLGGLGLGLAISKALAEAHQGTITAQSAGRNKGSTFALVFPTCEKAAAQIGPAVSPREPARQAMRILLVEDHEDTNRSLTNLLRRRGYQVQSALNFQSALDLSVNEQFDVLISDLALPDGTGIDLMQTLQSKRPLIGIALTGFGMEDDIRKGREAGFRHHLVKPIDLNRLDLLIQESANTLSPQ